MKQINKASRDNRANQLNPNNIQYYKSRVNMSKSNSYMPKSKGPKQVKLPSGTYRSRINVNDIYSELRAAINTRHQLDDELRRKWDDVNRGYARTNEIKSITTRIGNQTYKIDGIISKLLHHKNQRNAVKLAINYLEGERNRTDNIVRKWQRTVLEVDRGRAALIDPRGHRTHNTASSKNYIKNKQHRLQEINDMLRRLRS